MGEFILRLNDKWEVERSIKNERVFELKSKENSRNKAFFKKPRSKNSACKSIFLINELTCYYLGTRLDFPINKVLVASFLDEIGLFSPNFFQENLMQFYVPVHKSSSDPEYNFDGNFYTIKPDGMQQILGLHKLKQLFVFDQWIYALDRRPNNVMLERQYDELYLWAVDHEHTLNNGPDEIHPSYRVEVEIHRALRGKCHPTQMTYGIRSLSEIENAIRRIERISNKEIAQSVDMITDDVLTALKIGMQSRFLVLNNSYGIKEILKIRKKSLRKLINDCWQNWRRQTDLEML